jgi:hypothetical protein
MWLRFSTARSMLTWAEPLRQVDGRQLAGSCRHRAYGGRVQSRPGAELPPPEPLLLDVSEGRTRTCSPPADLIGSVVAVESLRHNATNDATVGIWRVRGSRGSAVVKLAGLPATGSIGSWPTSDDPAHWNYWRRESLAYTTDLAATVFGDGGITAPDLLAAPARADGLRELWLADVAGAEGFAWPVARIAGFAHELGVAQARWVDRVPRTPWLSRRWLAQYLTQGPARSVTSVDAEWDHPGVAIWPGPVRRELRRLWAERADLLAVAEAAPRTLCHLDVWPANLIDAGGTSVLLDWSFVGEGAVGEDVSNLIVDSFADGLMDLSLLPEVAAAATESYLGGLRDGGWSGSGDDVRRAIAACGAAKYSWLAPHVLARVVQNYVAPSSYSTDTDPEETAERLVGVLSLIAEWAGTAAADPFGAG